uniref:Uncharacterized protein n=1 Tax=Siphoviridae sp. ct2D011 TaxID=2825314 RepID=A0A8S5V943_9CAUD|nr:MAG TPA: hypothetical protein [Siphoviridae sp. ct2D011]
MLNYRLTYSCCLRSRRYINIFCNQFFIFVKAKDMIVFPQFIL